MNDLHNNTLNAGAIGVPNSKETVKNEEAESKKSKKHLFVIFFIGLVIVALFVVIRDVVVKQAEIENLKDELDAQVSETISLGAKLEFAEEKASGNYRIENVGGKKYYIITGDYAGEYDLQIIPSTSAGAVDESRVLSLSEYSELCKALGFTQRYTDPSRSYAVLLYVNDDYRNLEARLAAVNFSDSTVKLYVWDEAGAEIINREAYLVVVPVQSTVNDISVTKLIDEDELEKKKSDYDDILQHGFYKPIIYLYPEEETEVSVSLGFPEKLTTVYPAYNNGWKVLARPDGSLTDLATGRGLYALYWEGTAKDLPEFKEGFVVAGADSARFLEEKLAQLGLSEREAEEFIIYWLPKLEKSPYNLIRFETIEEIEAQMPLDIYPTPDTVIRVMMDFKALGEKIAIPEQVLPETPKREGFTAVEWGGSLLD